MAETNIIFRVINPKEVNTLCFTCAVRKILFDIDIEIEIASNTYSYDKCDVCDCFIDHRITI